MKDSVGGVIVTYNPSQDFLHRLAIVCKQVDSCVVIDNFSRNWFRNSLGDLKTTRNLQVIRNTSNEGIATALNQGIEVLFRQGFRWVVTFDQDSHPDSGMVHTLVASISSPTDKQKVFAVVPDVIEESFPQHATKFLKSHPHFPFLFERVPCSAGTRDDCTLAITSGMMINLRTHERIGPFREEFFIDYVDTEYCLRAKSMGFVLRVCGDAKLYHNLGRKREFALGPVKVRPTFHDPVRRYYISRNRIFMLNNFGCRFPHWLAYDLCASSYSLFRVLLFEDKKLSKLFHSVLGSIHGIRGRTGPLRT